jgi:DNA-binding response OmpR family regulator
LGIGHIGRGFAPTETTLAVLEVLVVDDEKAVRDGLSCWLGRRQFWVRTASGLKSAVQAVLEKEPDVILLDVRLGSEDGLQLVTLLRKKGFEIPCVVFTAHAGPHDGFRAHELGVAELIEKPSSSNEIARGLRAAAMSRRSRAANQACSEGPAADPARVFTQPRWDVAARINAIAQENCSLPQHSLGQLVQVLSDSRLNLVEFSVVATLVKTAARNPAELTQSPINSTDRLQFTAMDLEPALHAFLLGTVPLPHADHQIVSIAGPRRLRHRVHQATGKRLSSWIRLERLQRAVQELARGDEQVAQIAHRLGFQRGGQLARDVRLLIGLSPKALRHSIGANPGHNKADFGNK